MPRRFAIFGTPLSPRALLRYSWREGPDGREFPYSRYDPFVDDWVDAPSAGRFWMHGDVDLVDVKEEDLDAIKHRLRIATGATSH